MAKVRWHVSMSLDGFTAGLDDGMEWATRREPDTQSAMATEFMNSLGAIVTGRRSYDIATAGHRSVATLHRVAWKGPLFVLTHRPLQPWQDPTVQFVSGGVIDALETAARAAKGKAVGILGANVAQQCLEAGLIDDILVHLVPVLLGEGVPLCGVRGLGVVGLEPVDRAPSGLNTDLLFRVLPRVQREDSATWREWRGDDQRVA